MFFLRRVTGDSMNPTLENNQLILCSQDRNFKAGQVVVAFVKNKEVVKRIAKIENSYVLLEVDDKKHAHNGKYYAKILDTNIEGIVIWPRNL
jgi:phage repressor protein C with HTH and peptisase S24 domain